MNEWRLGISRVLYFYWGLPFARLARYMEHWKVPARFFGLVIGRRVFIGVLLGSDPPDKP
jgi:hypothetical protein